MPHGVCLGELLIDPGPKAATLKAAQIARKAGRLVSFDPNWRTARCRTASRYGHLEIRNALTLADVVKVSGEEWRRVTGTDDCPLCHCRC